MATADVHAALYQAAPDWLSAAVETLAKAGIEVIAPVEQDEAVVVLAPVASADEMALGRLNTTIPLKRLFLPETEVLLEFDQKPDGDIELDTPPPAPEGERVVVGCRPCDAAAVDAIDRVFAWDYDDVRYRAQRDRTTVVTFACTAPDACCFCTSVGGSPHGERGSDALAFAGDDGSALIQPLTGKGERLVERLGETLAPAADAAPPEPPTVHTRFDPAAVKAWLDEHFDDPFWDTAALRCVGCGACSFLCPTCHCFDIVDEATWNRGERRRNWDCCSFAQFTLHASGHNPRGDQAARYRQRVMHKFKYFVERFQCVACAGCGRCLRACGVGQSLLRVLTQIEELQQTGE